MTRAPMNDGGPAFPALEEYAQFDEDRGKYVDHYAPHGGMTLRDYFAAKAMQGRLANGCNDADNSRLEARICYQIADAMLEAREGSR